MQNWIRTWLVSLMVVAGVATVASAAAPTKQSGGVGEYCCTYSRYSGSERWATGRIFGNATHGTTCHCDTSAGRLVGEVCSEPEVIHSHERVCYVPMPR